MATSTTAAETVQRSPISLPSRDQIRSTVQRAQSSFDGVDQQVRAFVKERPFAAVAGAIVAGFVVGRIFSRL